MSNSLENFMPIVFKMNSKLAFSDHLKKKITLKEAKINLTSSLIKK